MALTQVSSEGIKDAQVKTADILDANITTAKIADNAITGGKIADTLDIIDNNKIRFGTGADLQIYHNPSEDITYIKEANAKLRIASDGLALESEDNNEWYLSVAKNGGVLLAYDNVKKFETYASGTITTGHSVIHGNISMADGHIVKLGSNDDLQIKHDGSNSYQTNSTGFLFLQSDALALRSVGQENYIVCTANGAVDLYHDNSKKFETGVSGEYGSFTASNGAGGWSGMAVGSGVVFMSNGTDAGIWNDTDNEWMLKGNAGAATELQYDGTKKLETTSAGATVSGQLTVDGNLISYSANNNSLGLTGHRWNDLFIANDIDVLDNGKLLIGNSDDLQIYHDGTGNIIDSHNSYLDIICNNDSNGIRVHTDGTVNIGQGVDGHQLRFGAGDDLQIQHDGTDSTIHNNTGNLLVYCANDFYLKHGTEKMIAALDDGAVELYYDNSLKFQTTSAGAHVWGNLDFMDNAKVRLGNNTDLQIYHDGTTNIIEGLDGNMSIRPKAGENGILLRNNGSVDLYYDDSKKLETNGDGVHITGDLTTGGSTDTAALIRIDHEDNNGKGELQINAWGSASLSLLSNFTHSAVAGVSNGAFGLATAHSRDINICTNGTKRMNIRSAGQVVIGGDGSDRAHEAVTFTPNGDSGACIATWNRANTTAWSTALRFQNSDGTKGYIRYDDASTQYYSASDYRLKENDVAIANGITKVKQLRPIRFNWKGHSDTVDGFFAHEVQAVIPDAVAGTKDAVDSDGNIEAQMLEQSRLIPLLTAALKEAISEIETLKTKVAALEAG